MENSSSKRSKKPGSRQAWLCAAAELGLFSQRVVGWSTNASMTAQLVTDALMMAIWRRGPTGWAAASLGSRQPNHI